MTNEEIQELKRLHVLYDEFKGNSRMSEKDSIELARLRHKWEPLCVVEMLIEAIEVERKRTAQLIQQRDMYVSNSFTKTPLLIASQTYVDLVISELNKELEEIL